MSISNSNLTFKFECRISNTKLESKNQIECRISNIDINLGFKFRMSNIEYQTKSNIQIECRILSLKYDIQHSNVGCLISNINTQSNVGLKSNVEYRISNLISHSNLNVGLSLIFDIRHSTCWIEIRMSNIEY